MLQFVSSSGFEFELYFTHGLQTGFKFVREISVPLRSSMYRASKTDYLLEFHAEHCPRKVDIEPLHNWNRNLLLGGLLFLNRGVAADPEAVNNMKEDVHL